MSLENTQHTVTYDKPCIMYKDGSQSYEIIYILVPIYSVSEFNLSKVRHMKLNPSHKAQPKKLEYH